MFNLQSFSFNIRGKDRTLLWLLKIRTQIMAKRLLQMSKRSTDFERMSRKREKAKRLEVIRDLAGLERPDVDTPSGPAPPRSALASPSPPLASSCAPFLAGEPRTRDAAKALAPNSSTDDRRHQPQSIFHRQGFLK